VGKIEGAGALRAISRLPVAVAGAHVVRPASSVAGTRVRALSSGESHEGSSEDGLDHRRDEVSKELESWIGFTLNILSVEKTQVEAQSKKREKKEQEKILLAWAA
jgi:hypothetical protein